jgi:hypothetical protein
MCASRGKLTKLNYLDIKQLLDRHIAQNKRGSLTSREVNFWYRKFMIAAKEMNYGKARWMQK